MIDYKKKLAAWLHDPAEKALILLRDKVGHEKGTRKTLGEKLGLDFDIFDKRADHLAAAADRPQWPRPEEQRFHRFEQVDFTREPELIHPLSGARINLAPLQDVIGVSEIKAASFEHFERLIQDDPKKTFLAFWRFGPEAGNWASELGNLWRLLPADTRVPDHSIWMHIDMVSAIHTALVGDSDGPDQPALLTMSFGPVQSFISQARSTSDLWAGSHLLSTLVWEAMRSIVEQLGPDVVVFPSLRGVPAVDRWLLQVDDSFRELFEGIKAEFIDDSSDTNPLFAASLPNKFLAIVPARQAQRLAEEAVAAIRSKALELAKLAAQKVFEAAGVAMTEVTEKQIADQLAGFPEAYWAAATWPVSKDINDVTAAADQLKTALASIHPELTSQGIFSDSVWPILSRELKLEEFVFWSPNTGVLYPAVYELSERALAAAKATRSFTAITYTGHRCTLTGEGEWLTHDRSLLSMNRTERKATGSVWSKLAENRRSWVKNGEHLGAIATLKRLWPTLFAEDLQDVTEEKVKRYIVSTHALALSTSIERLAKQLLQGDASIPPLSSKQQKALAELEVKVRGAEPATMPKRIMPYLKRLDTCHHNTLKRLPAYLDAMKEENMAEEALVKQLFGEASPENYYALIQMDGDRMGGWLAGNEDDYKLAYRETWHRRVKNHVSQITADFPELKAYLDTKRTVSPGRHAAISQALNDFSTHLARYIVEDCCKGKLLYAGGDDVLALVAVDDLFDAMQLLRLAYSGLAPAENMYLADRLIRFQHDKGKASLMLDKGFAFLRDKKDKNGMSGRLMTLMGHKATASVGAVVAHHTAPLSMVLRQLREAGGQAKSAGRDRFCLRVLKRGGGEVSTISPWWAVGEGNEKLPHTERSALALMKRFAQELALTAFSRGALYKAQIWFEGLTDGAEDGDDPRWRAQIAGALACQFVQQKGSRETAQEIVDFVCDVIKPQHPRSAIENFLMTSEFFAREGRAFQLEDRQSRDQQLQNQVKEVESI